MEYLNFDLEIGQGNGQEYPVVVNSPLGEARITMHFPFDEQVIKGVLNDLRFALLYSGNGSRWIPLREEEVVRNFGKSLFEALIVGEVLDLYKRSQSEADQQNMGLRLRLHIQESKLAALPWEFLYDDSRPIDLRLASGQSIPVPKAEEWASYISKDRELPIEAKNRRMSRGYLCLSQNTSIIRFLEQAQSIQKLTVQLPLRILGMIASPIDEPSIKVEREKVLLQKAIEDLELKGLVELSWVKGQTLSDLEEALRQGPWHIFHFIGYEGFNPDIGDGVIALINANDKKSYELTATQLAHQLTTHGSIRLVLLSTSERTRGSEYGSFSSIAATLVQQGIPSVLVIPHEISSYALINFVSGFYGQLVDGMQMHLAITNARKVISQEVTNSLAWGVPILYSHSPDDRLIEPDQKPSRLSLILLSISIFGILFFIGGLLAFIFTTLLGLNTWSTLISGLFSIFGVLIGVAIAIILWVFASQGQSVIQEIFRWTKYFFRWFKYRWYGRLLPEFSASRRKFIIGGLGLGLAGGIFFIGRVSALLPSQKPKLSPSAGISRPLPLGTTLSSNGAVNSVAWSPKGQLIAFGGADNSVQVWDVTTGKTIQSYQDNAGPVYALAWSPDGGRFVSASNGPQTSAYLLQVRDTSSGSIVSTYNGHSGSVYAVAWSPDGKYIASGSADGTVQIWDASTGNTIFTYNGHSDSVYAVAWSPDGKYIASGSADGTVQVWKAYGPYYLFGEGSLVYRGHSEPVNAVSWSLDGKRIASGGDDNTIQVWDVATNGGNIFSYHGHVGPVITIAWSPDGKYIASGSDDKTVQVWDATSGRKFLIYSNHSGAVNAVTWSPDGNRIASGSDDKTMQIWNIIHVFSYNGHSDAVNAVTWSPDGNRIASGSDDKTVRVWDTSTGNTVSIYRGHFDSVKAVVWSPKGKYIASGSADGTVQIWDATNGDNFFTYHGHNKAVNAVAWSPDGKHIVSGSDDETLQICDATTGEKISIFHFPSESIIAVAWSPDGKHIASMAEELGLLRVLDAVTGTTIFDTCYNSASYSLSWSPDGMYIVSGGDNRTARLWNATTGESVLDLRAPYEEVKAVAWFPSKNRIILASNSYWPTDTAVVIWDATINGNLLTYYSHSSAVNAVAWSLDGQGIASGNADSTVKVWQVV